MSVTNDAPPATATPREVAAYYRSAIRPGPVAVPRRRPGLHQGARRRPAGALPVGRRPHLAKTTTAACRPGPPATARNTQVLTHQAVREATRLETRKCPGRVILRPGHHHR